MIDASSSGPRETRVPFWARLVALLVTAWLLLTMPNVLMLLFASVLLAVLLRGLTTLVMDRTSLGESTSFTLVVVTLALLLAGTVWLVASSMADQIGRFSDQLPAAWQQFEHWLDAQPWGATLRRYVPGLGEAWTQLFEDGRTGGLLSSTFGVLADLFVLVFVALYLASDSATYVTGAVRLLPPARRARACEVLHTMASTLRRWLVGRFVLMLSNGVVTWLAMWVLGIPMAFVLGLLSGLLNFVPNIGPFLAAVPAVLLGFTVGPTAALEVTGFYAFYQMLDGYVLTPLVQRRTVSLPPALTISSQVLLGVQLGASGVLLAVPLVAVLLVLVKMAYVSDVLHEEVTLPDHVEKAGRAETAGTAAGGCL